MNPVTRPGWWSGLWTVASIDLRQRVRGTAWYVLLGVYVTLLLIVSVVVSLAAGLFGGVADGGGDAVAATVLFVAMLLATLVSPALSGGSINGDRIDGTLATTQVTLVSTTQIVLGRFLAAWLTSVAFVAATIPFIVFAAVAGGLDVGAAVVAILVIAVEMAAITAFGVGLSGLLRRPLFSVVVAYLVVAALSIGTLIGFVLGGMAVRSTIEYRYTQADWERIEADYQAGRNPYLADGTPKPEYCDSGTVVSTSEVPRFDAVWWILAANPYVVLADATPMTYDRYGNPSNVFGWIKVGVRQAQVAPELVSSYSDCEPSASGGDSPSAGELVASTVPSWFVGLALHVALGAGLLVGAVRRTATPARRVAPGQRIA